MVSNGRKVFTVILIIIILVALGLGGYVAYRYISDSIVASEASEVVDEFQNLVAPVAVDDKNQNIVVIPENNVDNQVETPTQPETGRTTSTPKTIKYNTFTVIGTIEIPATGVKYPIVSETSPSAMESAIVFLYGPGLNEIGNSIIVGHNYRSGAFFGSNKNLDAGDKIYITDGWGREVEYTVYHKYETTDDDFTYASRETNGKREISLSTCTSNASIRLIIWARES